MNTVGFPISHKEHENRRALLPDAVRKISHPELLFFEKNYGAVLGIDDIDYVAAGANICSRNEVLSKKIICDPKVGDADYLNSLQNQIIFGWIHAVQNKDIADKIVNNHLTAYAWEDMFYKNRHVFWRNNELAGEAAVLHAFQTYAMMPYETRVAVIGKGNTARGAIKILNMLGADVTQYDRKTEELLREEIYKFDVIVNCVLWDTTRLDHIIYIDDLDRMKRNAMIVDVSCDRHGGIESSHPTTMEKPTYLFHNVLHYAVDHTPTIFHKTFTKDNSDTLWPFINELVCDTPGDVLKHAEIIENGKILDDRIIERQRMFGN